MKFHEYLIDENDGEGGWVDTHYFNDPRETDEVTVGEEAKENITSDQQEKNELIPKETDDSDDSEAEDIESYMKGGLDDEDDAVSVASFD